MRRQIAVALTVADLAAHDTPDEHAAQVVRWASDVWAVYGDQHAGAALDG